MSGALPTDTDMANMEEEKVVKIDEPSEKLTVKQQLALGSVDESPEPDEGTGEVDERQEARGVLVEA